MIAKVLAGAAEYPVKLVTKVILVAGDYRAFREVEMRFALRS